MYKKTINKVEHYLYDSITEYKLYHKKEPIYWKEGKEGDWVVSDDDKVERKLQPKNGYLLNTSQVG